ncbi:MAG TPA: kelch repeat-containing protein, partial [Acidimicrobiales bacterium]|nr:kelch repeat-containing protein [Acidimicrobiales bacterium]
VLAAPAAGAAPPPKGLAAPAVAAAGQWTVTGALSPAREGATATVLADGDVLVAGGQTATGGSPTSSAALYDPSTGSWHATGPLPLAVTRATATLLADGDVLVAGGEVESGGTLVPTGAVERYDAAHGTWSTQSALPSGLAVTGAVAARLPDGKVLVAGGLTGTGSASQTTSAAELYDPSARTWTAAAPLPLGVADAAVAPVGSAGGVLVAGGLTKASGGSAGVTDLSEEYDPSSGTWSAKSTLPAAVTGAAASALPGGGVLVAGGDTSTSGSPTNRSERFDPATGGWGATGSLPVASYDATLTALSSGTLVYAGGFTSETGTVTAAAALYDPSSSQWSATGALRVARGDAAAARLADGDVLVVGGRTGASTVTGESEVYGTGTPPVITSAGSLALYSGAYSSFTVTATGSPTPTLSLSGRLPAGISFTPRANGTATISGTPAPYGFGTYVVDVTASNGVGAAVTKSMRISLGRGVGPRFTSAATLALRPGVYSSFTVRATGTPAPVVTRSGGLPAGMAFAARANGTATITGVPSRSSAGTYAVALLASNGVGSPARQTLRITVRAEAAPRITSPAALGLHVGSYARFNVTASGDPVPRISLSGRLPLGMSFVDNHNGTAYVLGAAKAAAVGSYAVTVTATNGIGAPVHQTLHIYVAKATPAPTPAPPPVTRATGYWYVTATGRVVRQGSATLFATSSRQGPREIVAMGATRDGRGYYLVSSFGGVFNYGDAHFYGSLARVRTSAPVVAFAVTPDGRGYYLVTAGGAVYRFGDASYYGSPSRGQLASPVSAFAVTPSGHGYVLATRAGSVYAYGDAHVYSSLRVNARVRPVVAIAFSADGRGYYLVTSKGNVYNFGDAKFHGSTARRRVPRITAFAPTPDGRGYYLVTAKGNVYNFGGAPFHGSSARTHLPGAVVGFAVDR